MMDPKHKQILSRNLPYLCNTLDPLPLLAHLTCLSQSSKEQIECTQDRKGKRAGVMKLHEFLTCSPRAWRQLIVALRDPDLQMMHVAEKLDPSSDIKDSKENSSTQSSKHSQPAFTDSSTLGSNSSSMVRQGSSKSAFGRDTPWNDLNIGVRDILKQLDVNEGGDKLAEALDLTIKEYQDIKTHKSNDGVALGLIENWNCKKVTTLGQLMSILKQIERLDVLHDLEKATGVKLPEKQRCEHKNNPGYNTINSRQNISKDVKHQNDSNIVLNSQESFSEVDNNVDILPVQQELKSILMPEFVEQVRQDKNLSNHDTNNLEDKLSQQPGSDSMNNTIPGISSFHTQLPGHNNIEPGKHLFDRSLSVVDETAVLQPCMQDDLPLPIQGQIEQMGTVPREVCIDGNRNHNQEPAPETAHETELSFPLHYKSGKPYAQCKNVVTVNENHCHLQPFSSEQVENDLHRVSLIRQESQPPGFPLSPVSLSEYSQDQSMYRSLTGASASNLTENMYDTLSEFESNLDQDMPKNCTGLTKFTVDQNISSALTDLSDYSKTDDNDDSNPWWEGKVVSDCYTTDVTVHTMEEDSINNNGNSYEGTLAYPSASNCQSIRPFRQPVSIDDDVIDVNKISAVVDTPMDEYRKFLSAYEIHRHLETNCTQLSVDKLQENFTSDIQELTVEQTSSVSSQSISSNESNDTAIIDPEKIEVASTSELSSILRKGQKPFPDVEPNYHLESEEDAHLFSDVDSFTGDCIQEQLTECISGGIVEASEVESLKLFATDMTSRGAEGLNAKIDRRTDDQMSYKEDNIEVNQDTCEHMSNSENTIQIKNTHKQVLNTGFKIDKNRETQMQVSNTEQNINASAKLPCSEVIIGEKRNGHEKVSKIEVNIEENRETLEEVSNTEVHTEKNRKTHEKVSKTEVNIGESEDKHEQASYTEVNTGDEHVILSDSVTNDANTFDNEGLSNGSRRELDNENFIDNDSTVSLNQNLSSGLFSWPSMIGGAVVGTFIFMSLKK